VSQKYTWSIGVINNVKINEKNIGAEMFISIVIPLYNKARHVKDTIQSVLKQSYQDFEIIVVDDGSTDNGAEVVSQINDPRIILIRQINGGVSKARNTGIENSSHELIAFLDGDDTWLPNHLETLHRMAINFPEAGIYSTAYIIRTAGKNLPLDIQGIPSENFEGLVPDYFKSLALGDNITWSSAVAIKKSIFKDIGTFPIGVRMGEDQDMWLRIALKYSICFSTTVTAIYNWETDNRACYSFKLEDFNSPLLTTWFDYDVNGYAKKYILKTQLNLLLRLIIDGYGSQARKVLLKIASKHGFNTVIPYYFTSFLTKNIFDNLKNIKNFFQLLKIKQINRV
jgi:glycosyltransferase involved in cell wall biosynthesis